MLTLKNHIVILLFIATLLSGCAPLDIPTDLRQDRCNDTTLPPNQVQTIGQTFIAHRPNLSAVEVLLAAPATPKQSDQAASTITFHLRRSPQDPNDLATVVVNTGLIQQEAVLHFDFTPQADSAGKSYAFFLSGTASNLEGLRYATLDVYQGGTRLADQQAAPGDLWFITYYQYGALEAAGEIGRGLTSYGSLPLLVLLVSISLSFLPGCTLLILTGVWPTPPAPLIRTRVSTPDAPTGEPGQIAPPPDMAQGESAEVDWLAWLALAFGLSLALAPLLLLWSNTFGLRLGRSWMLALLVGMAALSLYGLFKKRAQLRPMVKPGHLARGAAWVLLFTLILAVRFIQIRQAVLPVWVDSVHHTLIARLIADSGRLPSGYQPFIPANQFYYQYGFHAWAAYCQWVSGLEMSQVVLIFGQVLNAGAALSVYLLAVRLTGRRLAGACAALVTGLISVMPAYYVSWGRYTQLMGLNILPAALALSIEWLEGLRTTNSTSKITGMSFRLAGLLPVAICLAGLFLTHYRVLFFAACFFLIYSLAIIWQQRHDRERELHFIIGWAAAGGLALLLALPWLLHLVGVVSAPSETVARAFNRPAEQNTVPLDYILSGFDRTLIALAVGGCVWGLLRRQSGLLMMIAWVAVVLIAVNPALLGLPTIWLTSNTSTLIILYLPFSVAVGYLVNTLYDYICEMLGKRWQPWAQAGLTVLLIVTGLMGIWQQIPVINPNTLLVETEDVEAMSWIEHNTPTSAVFLVNTRLWTGKIYMGSDGGWWIPLLTSRQNTLPAAIYSLAPRAYIQRVNALAEAVLTANSLDEDKLREQLREWGVTHVYVGARGGNLTPWMLASSPYYEVVYTNGPVWIFAVK